MTGKVISLPAPNKNLDATLMQCLQNRQSVREFADRELSLEDLSSLLWAADGVNREDGKRTAPSALNTQDVDIYVCAAGGAYLYNAPQHQLEQVTEEDVRKLVSGRQPLSAPIFLVLVIDMSRYPAFLVNNKEVTKQFGSCDAGFVSQNICLYCTAAGLNTAPRTTMEIDELSKALHLTESQLPVINNPVGYKK